MTAGVPPHREVVLETAIRTNRPSSVGLPAVELLRRAWGQGYATEATSAVLDWARSSGYERLWATVREFTETGREEADPVHGNTLFTTYAPEGRPSRT